MGDEYGADAECTLHEPGTQTNRVYTWVGEEASAVPPVLQTSALTSEGPWFNEEPSGADEDRVALPPPPDEADDSEESMDTLSENAESLSGLSVLGAPFETPDAS